jgi:hypothetical protein
MTPGPEDEVSQAEKRRIIREQASSILDHAQAAANDMAGGRFASVNAATVVGAQPLPVYPQLPSSSPWSGAQPEPGIEPPLGFDNPAFDESSATILHAEEGARVSEAPPSAVQAPPLPADGVETGAGAPPFSEGTDNG